MNKNQINSAVNITEVYVTVNVHLQSAIGHLKTITNQYARGVDDIEALYDAVKVIETIYRDRKFHRDIADVIEGHLTENETK